MYIYVENHMLISLDQWFSARHLLPFPHFLSDLWQCLKAFFVVAVVLLWVEAKDASKCPTIHRTAPRKQSIQPEMAVVLRLGISDI